MAVVIAGGMVYRDHTFCREDLLIEGGRIRQIGTVRQEGAQVYPADGLFVAPGFLDVHTHGAAGVDLNEARAEELEKLCRFFAAHGTTGFLGSILTDCFSQTMRCIGEYRRWKEGEHRGACLEGLHLEGPFLSPAYKGAMPEQFLQKGNIGLLRRYQEAADGAIRYLTVSPEVEGIGELIREASRMGIRVSVGHSGADYKTTRAAIACGAAAATHTGNAMRPLDRHEPGIFGAVLEDEGIYAEMICDGKHLHPGIVRLITRLKGTERILLVTDSIMAAGMPDGDYRLGVHEVTVKQGDARLKNTGVRAGSTLTMDRAFRNLMAFTGLKPAQALPALTENPARLLGLWDQVGFLEEGKRANLVLLDGRMRVRRTMVDGVWCAFGDD